MEQTWPSCGGIANLLAQDQWWEELDWALKGMLLCLATLLTISQGASRRGWGDALVQEPKGREAELTRVPGRTGWPWARGPVVTHAILSGHSPMQGTGMGHVTGPQNSSKQAWQKRAQFWAGAALARCQADGAAWPASRYLPHIHLQLGVVLGNVLLNQAVGGLLRFAEAGEGQREDVF